MDILRANAKAEFDCFDTNGDEKKFAQEARQSLTIITGYSSAAAEDVKLEYSTAKENELTERIDQLSDWIRPVGDTPEQSTPCFELVYLPPPEKKPSDNFPKPKGFSITKDCFHTLFKYLGIDYALLSYLTSSRSGWYCVRGQDDRHSFLYKDYMYTLAWTFHAVNKETRGMLAARSDFKDYSKLYVDGGLKLPTLSKALLDQPLALAFVALTDCVTYLEKIIETDGYKLGKIEGRTGYGLWVKPGEKNGKETGKASADINLTELEEALRNIARLIGQFLTLFKSVEISQSMTKTIEQAIEHPDRWGAPRKPEDNDKPLPWEEAVTLLKARIHSVDQSGKATIRRAKAMSNVVSNHLPVTTVASMAASLTRGQVSGLISRLVARRAVADGSSMKVIALMTMFFLPATFISALWAVPALDKEDVLTTQNFGIYWVVTIPVTLVVFIAWYVLNNDWRLLLERIKELHSSSEQRNESPPSRIQEAKSRDPEMGLIEATSTQRNSN